MLTTIQDLLKTFSPVPQQQGLDHEQAVRTATVALLVEVARADFGVDDAEREVILRIIERHYAVTLDEARVIADEAESHADDATCLHPLTRLITSQCSIEEREEIVRLLWEVSFADGHVDKHEEHLVRKVADLLYVPHNRFIKAKLEGGPAG
jgi:uncharacterized tellurite resistance protein B-like protein